MQTALESSAQGSDAWNTLLAELGLAVPAAKVREQLALRQPLKKGALPVEVRHVLERLQTITRKTLSDAAVGDETSAAFEKTLEHFVEEDMTLYLKAVRPAASPKSIFATAKATTKKYGDMNTKAVVEIVRCKSCGAARPEGTDLRVCDFCGGNFF